MNKVLNISVDSYHADLIGDGPTLSASEGHVIVSKSPAHLCLRHPRFGNVRDEATKRMDKGALVHELLLGKGKGYKVIMGFDDYRKKDAQAARDEIRAAGQVPVLESDFNDAVSAIEAIKPQIEERGIDIKKGQPELMLAFEDATDDGEIVQCRAMLDLPFIESGDLFEFKTVGCADPARFGGLALNMGYDCQLAVYERALSAVFPELAGRIKPRWILAEIEPPYCVTVDTPTGETMFTGNARWQRALNLWHSAITTGRWPGYTDGCVDLPAWASAKEMEEV